MKSARVKVTGWVLSRDILHPVNHATTDFKEQRPPANGTPTFQSPF